MSERSVEGAVAPELRAELPGLGLRTLALPAPSRLDRASPGLRERLELAATRIHGGEAVTLRQRPVTHAYRVFFRHIGLDPDATRVPLEALVVARLVKGGLPSRGLLDDALTLALVETGVAVWALDGDRVEGALRLRLARDGERLGRDPAAAPVPAGRIVVADETDPLAILFGDLAPRHGATRATRALLLFAVRVAGVGAMEVEEALWTCAEALDGA